MKGLKRAAVILRVIDELRHEGSWCGETSIQKSCYLLQEMLGVPLSFEFILYKHGPYSFGLTDELTALRADSIIDLVTSGQKYGPRYVLGELASTVERRFPKTISEHEEKVRFLAKRIGSKNVSELERLATAFFVKQIEAESAPIVQRAKKLIHLKPHIKYEDSLASTRQIDDMIEEARDLS